MSDGYQKYLTFYQDVSGNSAVSTKTLVTVRNARNSLFLQKAHFQVTGGAAGTWELRDSTDVELTGPVETTTDGSHWDFDFGPAGVQLTEGTSLKCVKTGTGTGIVTWEAYQKLTAVTSAANA